jgi:hypothetical protein
MKYVNRTIEPTIQTAIHQFPAVALTGPRQAGKSTLLQHLYPNYTYYTFDDPVLRQQAKDDPGLFLENLNIPAILDEIQYAPEILPYIKISVDRNRDKRGQYLFTGSQVFHLMAGLTETLAGRVALFELLPFSFSELGVKEVLPLKTLFEYLYSGFYPDPCIHGVNPRLYYGSYFQTYLERDIRQITSVQDLSQFQRFVELLAARAGSVLNISEVARDCGISHTTAHKWLSLLENSRIIYLLKPYFGNIGKRIVKSPRLYFTDTGLLAYLLKYPDPSTFFSGPAAGNIFENFIIAEFLKDKFNRNGLYELYYYRDSNKNEVDLVIEEAQQTHAVEIKMRQNIRKEDARFLDKLEIKGKTLTRWLITCFSHEIMISEKTKNLPWWKAHSLQAALT